MVANIRPLPDNVGVGFQSHAQVGGNNFREEQSEHAWRYFAQPGAYEWPYAWAAISRKLVIDGFSPNLNKSLHIGHLRQLALARCLSNLLGRRTEFVAILGCHGILQKAQDELRDWFNFVGYDPKLYYDVLMPQDEDIVPRREGEGEQAGALVWDGPKEPVIVFRKADDSGHRRATYAFHDLAFAKTVAPDYYVTGAEQVEHFQRLGLYDKHLPMGLVLGKDGKKLKSRSGDSLKAAEAFAEVSAVLQPVPDPRKVVWNVIAWNLLATGRAQNVKFDPEAWVKPEAPGMYISYTWARINSALAGSMQGTAAEMTQADADLAGFAGYYHYHATKGQTTFDPAGVANYLYELCRKVTKAYHTERIRDGRPGFQFAVSLCWATIATAMRTLGMFPVVMREQDL